jgi:cell division protease FtsH
MDSTVKTVVFWFVIVLSATLLWQVVKGGNATTAIPEISYSEFLSLVDAGNVVKVTVSRNQINGVYRDQRGFRLFAPASQEGMLQELRQKNVEIWFKDSTLEGGWPNWILNLAPLILLAALWFFMIRQMQKKKTQP